MTRFSLSHELSPDIFTRVVEYKDRLTHARAAELALAGRFVEAEGLLDRHPLTADSLDLLARIQVRQGRLDAARQLWQQALSLNESSPAVRECLTTLERYRTARYHNHLLRWRISLGVWLVLLMLLAWWIIQQNQSS